MERYLIFQKKSVKNYRWNVCQQYLKRVSWQLPCFCLSYPQLLNKYTSVEHQLDDRRCGHGKFDFFLFGLNSAYFICLFLLNNAVVYSCWWLIRRYRDLGNFVVDPGIWVFNVRIFYQHSANLSLYLGLDSYYNFLLFRISSGVHAIQFN